MSSQPHPWPPRAIGLVGTAIVPTVFLMAAVAKLIDYPAFARSLDTYILLPDDVRFVGAVSTPAIEAVPFLLLALGRRLASSVFSLALLIVFTSILGIHWINNLQPDCACIGEWAIYYDNRNILEQAGTRNTMLLLTSLATTVAIVAGRRGAGSTRSVTI